MDIVGGFVRVLEAALLFCYNFTANAGLAIIVFTVAIKIVLLPLTISSLRSSREMQKLQPKIRELQKKYAKDREKLNQETMALYKEHGVNPAAGCLPMILQIPIFLGIWSAVNNLSRPLSLATLLGRWIGLSSLGIGTPDILTGFSGAGIMAYQPFLWMTSMGIADPWHVLPILAAALQLVQQKMMTPRDVDPQQATMNNAMMIMPLLFIFIGWSLPAGPVLYWVTQSVFGIVQQYFTSGWGSLTAWLPFLPERKVTPEKAKAKPQATAASATAGPQQRGWFWRFMDRLGSMQQEAAKQEGLDGAPDISAAEVEQGSSKGKSTPPPMPTKRRSRK